MLTVIFATCNGARTLSKTLEAMMSVIAPGGVCQITAIDDGSTDASLAILDGYCDRLPLQVISHLVRSKNNSLSRVLQKAPDELVVFGGKFAQKTGDSWMSLNKIWL